MNKAILTLIYSALLFYIIVRSLLSMAHELPDTSTKTSTQHKTQAINITHTVPNIQHGIRFQPVADISQYYVSEKLDGIRGYWTGTTLLTRQGNNINSPHWFTQQWPTYPIDGELWIERNQFEQVLSCVSRKKPELVPSKSCWNKVKFMMFDLPQQGGIFSDRVNEMHKLETKINSPYFAMIPQVKYKTMESVENKLLEVMAKKGEGLMLHRASALYKVGRNNAIMKLKKHQDAEAIVIGYTVGTGKYEKLMGAMKVKTPEGLIFKIGSGFTDQLRATPPKIGAIISYKHNGFTQAGVPKFARFWRVKKQPKVE